MTIAAGPVKLDFDDYVLYTETHPNDAFELLDGVIYKLSPEGDSHLRTRSAIMIWLCKSLDTARFTPWTEASFPAPGWIDGPRPDNMVSRSAWIVDGRIADRPQADTIALVIEVSSSSRPKDKQRATLYAQLNIAEYWLVDLQAVAIVVHTTPFEGVYRDQDTFGRGRTVTSAALNLTTETDFLLALAGP